MKIIDLQTSMSDSQLLYERRRAIYPMEYRFSSEPYIKYYSHELGKKKPFKKLDQDKKFVWEKHWPSNVYKYGDRLTTLNDRIKQLEEIPEKERKHDIKWIKSHIKSLMYGELSGQFGKFLDGDAFELPDLSSLESQVSLHFVRLPWNNVRLNVNTRDRNKGYFICFGWSPIFNEIYYHGADFIPKRTAEEIKDRLKNAPEGRGIPDDVVSMNANCGPTSLAAYLNESCKEIIHYSHEWQTRGRISINPMLQLLEDFEHPHKSIKIQGNPKVPSEAFNSYDAGLAFIQFTGSNGKYDGWTAWSQAYAHTHWIAYDKGLVYDFNNRHEDLTLGDWIPEDKWLSQTMPMFMKDKVKGHYIRNILVPE